MNINAQLDPIELTRQIIGFNTINPPGNEKECAYYLANILENSGFKIKFFKFAKNRTNLIAKLDGKPGKLPIEGIDSEGVHFFQSLDDARQIMTDLADVSNAVIIGAGLIGMRAAYALNTRGIKTTLVEMTDRIMPVIMDRTGSDILVKAMKNQGTEVILETTVVKVNSQNGRVTGVILANGEQIPCRLLLIAAGVKPNVDFLKESGYVLESYPGLDR